jgi:hypothetical protein
VKGAADPPDTAPGLRLEVDGLRDSYHVGEPIYLRVRLRNETDDAVPVTPLKIPSADIEGNLGIVLSRGDGTREFHPRYDGKGRASVSPAPELLPHLAPGESWLIVVELLTYFGEEKGLISLPAGRVEVRRGTYALQAFYRWDYRPGHVVRSNVADLRVRKTTLGDRWRRWRIDRTARRWRGRDDRDALIGVTRDILARGFDSLLAADPIRRALMEGMRRDPLDVVGALEVIEDHLDGPPLFLYDLITYREPQTEEEMAACRRFLEELAARWPDGFVGEVARHKKRFEEIAVGGAPRGARPGGSERHPMPEEEER